MIARNFLAGASPQYREMAKVLERLGSILNESQVASLLGDVVNLPSVSLIFTPI